jgi:hypothetical protein
VNEIEFLEHLQRLDLKPGDVLVAKTKEPISQEMVARLQSAFTAAFAGTALESVRVVIVDDIELGALRVTTEELV